MTNGAVRPVARSRTAAHLSDDVVAALRERVTTGFYDQPAVMAVVARAVTQAMRGGAHVMRASTLPS